MRVMESFVVQIHRRPHNAAGEGIAGTVESIANGHHRPFNSVVELLALLRLAVPSPSATSSQPPTSTEAS